MQTARAVVFDIRGEGNNDLSFSSSAEVSLLKKLVLLVGLSKLDVEKLFLV